MSTRAHVVVKDQNNENYVYHHCDGYISGVGSDLKEFIQDIYIPINYTANEFCKQLENWDDSFEYENHGIHGDEEYIYHISIDQKTNSVSVTAESLEIVRAGNGWNENWVNVPEYAERFDLRTNSL